MDGRIVDGADNMRLDDIVRLLRTAYWAKDRPAEVIERAVQNSDCYGVCLPGDDTLAAFARVVSDHATMYWLSDVVVDEAFRGRGLGTALVDYVLSRPAYAGLRGFLITRDAHDLYRKFGFEVINDRVMVKPPRN